MIKNSTFLIIFLALALFGLGTSSAGIITFDSIAHGEEATTQIPGLTISAINFSNGTIDNAGDHPNMALGFDSGETGTRDDDLEGPPWAGGNLSAADLATLELGTMIIIAENSFDVRNNDTGAPGSDGLVDNPDDEGNRDAGVISFEFDSAITSVGFDLVDVEGIGPGQEPGNFAVFFMGGAAIDTVSFEEFLAAGAYDQGAVFGNNTVNRIAPIGGFGMFDRVDITLGGSGAVDNLVFGVPVPGVVGLLALGLGLLGLSHRRE